MSDWTREYDVERDHEAYDDRGERSRAGQALQGVCRDCHAATLNNDLNPAFEERVDDDNGYDYYVCIACGSQHLDVL
jgi:hypothetical protein